MEAGSAAAGRGAGLPRRERYHLGRSFRTVFHDAIKSCRKIERWSSRGDIPRTKHRSLLRPKSLMAPISSRSLRVGSCASCENKATIAKIFLGIRHAKGLSVHLANPRVTKERMRRWTGFAVALTVTFAVCDAQQIGLSPSDGSLLSLKTLTSLRMVRPEQKAPPVIAPLRFIQSGLCQP